MSFLSRAGCTLLLALAACGGGTDTPDANDRDAPVEGIDAPVALDAPEPRDGPTVPMPDAPSTSDAPVAEDAVVADVAADDAPTSTDASLSTDVGADAGCARSEPTRMAGVCDGRGRAICQMWSDGLGDGRMTTALCIGTGGFCARADRCASSDPDSCTCGAGPRCADDELCVFSEMRAPHCECLSP